MPTGDVEITILDGGAAVVVPGATVQVVIAASSSGTAAQVVATQNPNTLTSSFGQGPLPEAAALSALAGGTMLAMKATTATAGSVRGKGAALSIVSSTDATPIVLTVTAHGLVNGAVVTVAGHLVNTNADGTWKISAITANTMTLTGSVGTGGGAGGATGTVTTEGVNQVGTGTSEVTLTGTPNDEYYLKCLVVAGGTIGVTGITFQVSLDAGRNYGPVLALGTASTYALTNTGLTLAFSAGTLVAGDYATAGCIAPMSDTAGVIACLVALVASPYGVSGWSSVHIPGPWTAANIATIQTQLNTMGVGYIFTRAMFGLRDASPAAIWGGTAETEATWQAAIALDVSATDAKRTLATGGHYNTPSAFPNALAGAPSYRRSLSWSLAARQVTIPPQRHAGRVRDGSLQNIIISPTTDPSDGFIYHDERLNPGLDAARLTSARTRIKLPGLYIVNPKLLSAPGSVFTLLPLGNVMDIACTIAHEVGQQTINDDIRLNANGTIYEAEALAIESVLMGNLQASMISTSEISSATVTVGRTNNVLATSTVNIAITIVARGYILQENITIGFKSPFAAS